MTQRLSGKDVSYPDKKMPNTSATEDIGDSPQPLSMQEAYGFSPSHIGECICIGMAAIPFLYMTAGPVGKALIIAPTVALSISLLTLIGIGTSAATLIALGVVTAICALLLAAIIIVAAKIASADNTQNTSLEKKLPVLQQALTLQVAQLAEAIQASACFKQTSNDGFSKDIHDQLQSALQKVDTAEVDTLSNCPETVIPILIHAGLCTWKAENTRDIPVLQKPLAFFALALTIDEKIFFDGKDSPYRSQILMYVGDLNRDLGDKISAKQQYESALSFSKDASITTEIEQKMARLPLDLSDSNAHMTAQEAGYPMYCCF